MAKQTFFKRLALLGAAAFTASGIAFSAQAATFNVSATGVFEDSFQMISDTGTLTGVFEAEDTNFNGFLDDSEITSWSFETTGFSVAERNFVISDTGPAPFVLVDNTGTTNEIASGFSAGVHQLFRR